MNIRGDIQVKKFITGVVDTGDQNIDIEVKIFVCVVRGSNGVWFFIFSMIFPH